MFSNKLREKAQSLDKNGKAGPGTGSMGGKCSVCGDRATKFRYSLYSTTSCFSCRAFFRRSLVGNKFETFSCRSAGAGESKSCQVNASNRKKCQACRFAKCRQMGMTHTTLENQTFQLPSLPPSSTSTKYLSVKTNPTLSLSPIIETLRIFI